MSFRYNPAFLKYKQQAYHNDNDRDNQQQESYYQDFDPYQKYRNNYPTTHDPLHREEEEDDKDESIDKLPKLIDKNMSDSESEDEEDDFTISHRRKKPKLPKDLPDLIERYESDSDDSDEETNGLQIPLR
eukprot:scaffold232309_cov46-Attheya_sp.AAC.2